MTDDTTTIRDLRERLAQFVAERDWRQFHDPKNLSMSIAIEAAELMEHFQWVRSDGLDALLSDLATRAEIADELADVFCYALSLANTLNIDVAQAVVAKIAKNAAKYPADRVRGTYRKPAGPTDAG